MKKKRAQKKTSEHQLQPIHKTKGCHYHSLEAGKKAQQETSKLRKNKSNHVNNCCMIIVEGKEELKWEATINIILYGSSCCLKFRRLQGSSGMPKFPEKIIVGRSFKPKYFVFFLLKVLAGFQWRLEKMGSGLGLLGRPTGN